MSDKVNLPLNQKKLKKNRTIYATDTTEFLKVSVTSLDMEHNVVLKRRGTTVPMSEGDWTQLMQTYPNLDTTKAAL